MTTTVAVASLVLLLGPVGALPDAQEPATGRPVTFAAAVEVILVDAVVTDKQGRAVKGLTVDDFVVREDGVPQALTSFEAVDFVPPAVEAPSPVSATALRTSSNEVAPPSRRRVFLVVMDDAGLGLAGAVAARKAANQFLSETRPGDLVTVVAPAAGLTWSAQLPEGKAQLASTIESVKGLRAVAPELATDWEARQVAEAADPVTQERMRVRLDSSGMLPQPSRLAGESDEDYEARKRVHQEPYLQAEARRQLDNDRERRRRLCEAVRAALDSVSSVKGRKSVLLLSEGFIAEPTDPAFRGLVAAARRSNASFYSVDVQRLRSGAAADSRQAGDRSASTRLVDPLESGGADAIAEETGGFALHAPNDLEAALARVAAESSSYYLLGYSPTNAQRDGNYRKLRVEVRRADLAVRARKGYYAPAGDTPPRLAGKPDAELERALASAVPERQVPLRLTAFTMQPVDKGKVQVRLVAEVGLAPARFEKQGDGSLVAALDVAMALHHVEPAGRLRTPWREWTVRLPQQVEGGGIWVPLEGSFDVPAGACQARVAVRDRASHAIGSVLLSFQVPDPRSWRVSTPILSDVPGRELGSAPRPRVGRSFVARSPLYCYLEVYPGTRKGAAPRVSLAYTLVDAQGKSRKSAPASPVTLGPAGVPARLETIQLSGLPPGEYQLRLSVRDEVSGRAEEVQEPFVVRRPTRPDLAVYLELLQAFLAGEVARASSGVLEWRPQDLETLAASLPEPSLREAALMLHTALAFRLWGNARAPAAEEQLAIARAALGKDSPPELRRDWLLTLGYYRLAAASPSTALPFFEECAHLFPVAAEAWLGAGICHELAGFPDGFAFSETPAQNAARQAERCYREAVRLEPRLAEARLRLGRVLALTGALDEAEKALAAAAEDPAEPRLAAFAQVLWGGVRDARGDLPGAISHYRAASAADRECQTAAFALSEALFRSGRHRSAAESLVSALEASPSDGISPWHAYHVGSIRRKAPLPIPQEAAPLAAAAQPGGSP